MPPKHSAKVPSSVLKLAKVAMCLVEKTRALERFPSGVTYSAVGDELNANKLTIDIK